MELLLLYGTRFTEKEEKKYEIMPPAAGRWCPRCPPQKCYRSDGTPPGAGGGTTGDILAGLKEDKYDIVFSSYQEGEPDIEFRKIGNQKLVVAVPQDHPLAIHGSVDLRDTIAYPQIYFEKGSGLRPVIDQMFEEINQFPKVAFEMEEDSSMAGLVAQGFGIAVMPDIPILKSLNLKTLEISHPVYERSVYLATLKKHYLSPVAKSFIQFVCQQTEGR